MCGGYCWKSVSWASVLIARCLKPAATSLFSLLSVHWSGDWEEGVAQASRPSANNGNASNGVNGLMALPPSLLDIRLDELRQVGERLLPAHVAHLHGNGVRHAFLHDVQLGA